MKDLKPNRTPEVHSETRDGATVPAEKKKSLDELIEKFNRDSPARDPKKTYRGVY